MLWGGGQAWVRAGTPRPLWAGHGPLIKLRADLHLCVCAFPASPAWSVGQRSRWRGAPRRGGPSPAIAAPCQGPGSAPEGSEKGLGCRLPAPPPWGCGGRRGTDGSPSLGWVCGACGGCAWHRSIHAALRQEGGEGRPSGAGAAGGEEREGLWSCRDAPGELGWRTQDREAGGRASWPWNGRVMPAVCMPDTATGCR